MGNKRKEDLSEELRRHVENEEYTMKYGDILDAMEDEDEAEYLARWAEEHPNTGGGRCSFVLLFLFLGSITTVVGALQFL